MDPPAAAESTKNPATETKTTCFPATTETVQKENNDGNHYKNVSCHDGNHLNKTTQTLNKRWMMSTMETIKKRPDGFRDELSIYVCMYIYIYI